MKLFKFLFSGAFMAILLLTFAFVIGYATFIENDYGAATARLFVYNTTWFELLLFLMVVNFSGMIFTKHLYLKSKWNILAIHLALIIIIIGAGVTRYFGYEGQMHIRNGETTSHYLSTDNYLQLNFTEDNFEQRENERIVLTTAKKDLFNKVYTIKGTDINISVSEYSPNSVEAVVPAENGSPFLTIIAGGKNGGQNIYLKEGTQKIGYDFGFSFGDTTRTDLIQIIQKDGQLYMRPPLSIEDSAATQNKFEPLKIMTVQKANDFRFIVKEFIEKGELKFIPATGEMPGKRMAKLTVNGLEAVLPLSKVKVFTVGNIEVSAKLGYQDLNLPFSIKLNAFDLDRYPGSNSPSSFASDVTVIDKLNNKEFPYRIYMNHILNYKGYRFFQSSYDPDEMGTVLSVNHDYWGTLITYVGYFLLFASLILSFFTKKTRFARITEQLKDVHAKRKKLTLPMIVFLVSMLGAQTGFAQADIGYQEHAKQFTQLFVQNNEGRIEPLNTLANKVIVKISKKSSFNNLSADEVFLGMISSPEKWQNELIIKVPEESVQQLIGVSGSYATFNDFIDTEGRYKLSQAVEKAFQEKPAMRTKHDKAIINVDERVNVFYMVLNKQVLKIFPLPNAKNNKWATPGELHEKLGHGSENGDLFENYLADLAEAQTSGSYQKANVSLDLIHKYQRELGGNILPSPTKAKLEIFYNETNIFKTLFPFYLSFGILLVAIFFLQTFQPKYEFKLLGNILFTILFIAFMAQTAGLALRWYISGHAPWSNGYESMIYISWATMLAGFVFRKRSSITLGVTATLAGITLLTAHMSWLNPELTNLVPVLKSYWLTIHVATITASYGFLGLGAMVAFLNLCLMIFRSKQNMLRVNLTIKELNLIVEMAITVGVVLLIIRNFK